MSLLGRGAWFTETRLLSGLLYFSVNRSKQCNNGTTFGKKNGDLLYLFPCRSSYYRPPLFLRGKHWKRWAVQRAICSMLSGKLATLKPHQNSKLWSWGWPLSENRVHSWERESKSGSFQVRNIMNSELCGRIVYLCASLHCPPPDIKWDSKFLF